MEQVINYIRPELLVLIPVLYLIGIGFKKSETIKDKHIPLLLGTIGVLLSILFVVATETLYGYKEVLMGVFTAVTQGVLCAGCSVYANQIYKQSKKAE